MASEYPKIWESARLDELYTSESGRRKEERERERERNRIAPQEGGEGERKTSLSFFLAPAGFFFSPSFLPSFLPSLPTNIGHLMQR